MLGKRAPITDLDILNEHHKYLNNKGLPYRLCRFLRDELQDKNIDKANLSKKDYGEILAKKYYDKLYKEFAIVDLSQYETGK